MRSPMRHLLIALALFLTACATGTYRHGFDVERFRSLEPGKATKTDVLSFAGPPMTTATGPDGFETWTYSRTEVTTQIVILPFYGHVQSAGPGTKVAVLRFKGEILERIDWVSYSHQ